jgi:amino acid adenylation domain-containing protein
VTLRVDIEHWSPLSEAQRGRWFLYRLNPDAQGGHNNVFTAVVRGDVDADALSDALRRLVRRHPMLRTRFRERDGMPEQSVTSSYDVPLIALDDATLDDAALLARIRRDATQAFDLDSGSLMRAGLYARGASEHVLMLAFDHIAVDGWSYWRLLEELGAMLENPSQTDEAAPQAAPDYAGYVAWQRTWLASADAATQRSYWDKLLADEPPVLQLPTDRPPTTAPGERDAVTVTLPRPLSSQLHALAQRHAATLYTTLLAAYQILLHRVTGQDDIAVGSPMPGRTRAEWDGVVGDFVNPIVLRTRFEAGARVADVMRGVSNGALRGMTHQDYPFARLVEDFHLARDAGQHPFYQTMFVFQNARQSAGLRALWNASDADASVAWGGFDLAPYPAGQSGNADAIRLQLEAIELEDGIRCDFKFDRAVFDRATIERLASHWRVLLEGLVEDDAREIAQLPLLSPAERAQVLVDFNRTRLDYAEDALVHTAFEQHAQRQPDAIALQCGAQRLSYGELDRRANRLAHRLLALGVAPDDRIAICCERGVDMAVGLLGILKAGGAYVPLDPQYPAERLAYMLEDSAPVAVLTQTALRDALPMLVAAPMPVIALDEDAQPPHSDGRPTVPGLTPEHLAYVIYTSGSTGRPKGVMIEHRNTVNLVAWARQSFTAGQLADTLFSTSINFDLAVFELFVPLSVGATVRLVRDLVSAGGPPAGTTLVNTVPSAIAAVLESSRLPASVKTVNLAGEPLKRALVEKIFASSESQSVANLYGPSETTTYSTWVEMARADGFAPHIGRPVANTQVYILDGHGQPVPIGVAGELYIGGAGVARGYLNQPELTAERFVVDPFSQSAGARMYKTGDLGRWRTDGNIEYLGRNDFQVKIRGFRIELGEIEAKLAACAGIREAVVVAREDVVGDRRLVAYVVPQDAAAELSIARLREQLSRDLPEYMTPSAFVSLAALPLTPNGKLDRKALPAPDQHAVATREYEAPQDGTERALAAIWQELLGLERVGRHDHFFDLGGHSLLAVRMVARVQATLGADVALRDVFAQSTLSGLARIVADASAAPLAAIVPVDRNGALPLSWAQQRLWFLDQLDRSAGAAYHIPAALRLRGALNRAALRSSLDRIVARHESLRTTFVSVAGEPRQVIAPEDSGFLLIEHDLHDLDDAAQTVAVAESSADEASAPFDLSTGPLIRGRLLRLAEHDHVLLITQHHIVSDGWSIGVLIKEIGALYAAFDAGRADPLPPLPIQYADYAAWQHRCLNDDALQAQTGFWRDRLDGAPALLALPTDRPRPAVQRYAGSEVEVRLTPELTAALRALSRRHGTTLFMTLLAGWSTLLSRLSGQTDVVVGTPVANRQRAEVEPLVGFFVNTLALRVDLTDDPSVAELLARIKATTLGAYAHQDLPFEQVVEAVRPVRSLSHSPIFQVMLALNNTPSDGAFALPGLVASPIANTQRATQFDVALSLTETSDGIAGDAVYATDLFDRATVERMLAHWTTLLEAMVADDRGHVSRLPLLSADERTQVLADFNATQAEYPHDRLVHALFEARVAQQPDAIAIDGDGERVSYAELNRRANRVAHRLIGLGVKPDDRVALCAERSAAMVVGMLGVLKAGGAYVPMDPAYPVERLGYMLADSAPVAVLTRAALRDGLPALAGLTCPVLALDEDFEAADHEDATDPVVAGLTSRHLAYVIYTSGSTGQPKGVMVEHRNVLRLLVNNPYAPLTPEDCVGHCSNPAFDASVWEIWGSLLSGARLLVVPQAVLLDAQAFNRFLVDGRVTAILLTTGLFNEYADTLAPAFSGLTHLLVGGDVLDARSAARVLQAESPPRRLINAYGPTESTMLATTFEVFASNGSVRAVPIGRPIANTQIYILDGRGTPVPVGVAGEIHIGGAGVARGYLNRPELTAERFLDDPFSNEADARMYKTGDLGRWLPDGNIEYLGRNDFQVKIRGFRIELGEIEAKLAACPGVREAVVVAREDVAGDKRLVAYVVSQNEDAAPSIADLRERLSRDLPEYMIPSAFVSLAALPLTPNGKLDRKALPAPDQNAVATREYEAPIGETEQAIAAIWQDLLGLDRIGRHDHFFELGGHSLLAVRLVTRLRAALGVDIALRDVFAQPTLSGLARIASNASASSQGAIIPADRNQPLPLSWAQQRLWFLDQLDHSAGAAYHIPAALRLSGDLNRAALQSSLDRIVARHESLRTTFVSIEGEPQQVIAPESIGFALTEYDLSNLDEAAQVAAIAEQSVDEASAAFDLATGPLIRGRLLRLAEHEHVLLVTQHHIVSDGWSIGVLIQEISALYTAFSQDQVDPLPALPIQYADYAAWQQQWLQGDVLQNQIDFWRTHLSGAPALLELPTDRPRPAAQSYVGDDVEVQLAPELTSALRALSQRHGVTLFMTLLAGWSALLSRLSGQDDVVIGSPIANRQRSEIEPLVGFFVNTLALRVDLSDDPSVADLLTQIKATTLGAYAHQDLPFEQVVEALQPERSLSHSPLFQALLTLDNTSANALDLPGLTLSTIDASQKTAQFDLALSLSEAATGLVGKMVYATDLFDRATVERMLTQWTTLLEAMVADDAQHVSRLPLLTENERTQVVTTFNATQMAYPKNQPIHALFEAQATRQPDAIALEFGGQKLSYADLNRRANQVAHRLIALGVQPDDCVALCMTRNVEMVVGLLGILKAGGGYVPLDPAYPAERLAYMLADSQPAALMTQTSLADVGVAGTARDAGIPTIELDNDDALSAQPEHDPEIAGLTSRHLVYVIYTSGSTGQPKGVMIEHANAVNLLTWAQASFSREQLATTLLSTSINFDLAVFELFVPLSMGATVRLVKDLVSAGPALNGTTLVNTVPSAIAAVLESSPLPATVKTVNLAGEPLKRALVEKIFASSEVQSVANLYGPSETTTYSTWVEMAREDGFAPHIGRPIANTQVYILDDNGTPVPIGVTGEIFIGGAGVARGYLNRPELTVERFLDDPFSGEPGARMYKTGDLGRWLSNGNIEYLGRNDFQVKIRGFRIELGEIEAKLADCPGVREAVVVAREDVQGDKRLVAYVVPQNDSGDLSIADLREQLSHDLPEYMIPSAFVSLTALPLTPNGKLDRKALPAPDQNAVATREYESPIGETEQAIAAVWQDLLGLGRVGRHDHFFELGGHSLLAVRLITRLRAALGVDVALRDVFAQPTLLGLARITSDASASSQGTIAQADRSQPLPLSWAQQRLWFLDQLDHSAGAAYHIPAALRLSGELNRAALQASLDRIVARHESLRTTFVNIEGEPQQVIAPDDVGFALTEHDLRNLDEAAQAAAVAEQSIDEARVPFDLATGPLIRGRLLRLAEHEHVLLVTQHHIVSDGWSIGVLVREVSALYTAFCQGRADPLPVLPIQYADYAAWQRQWLQGDVLEQQIDYWRSHLGGAPALLELPTDRARPAVRSYAGGSIQIRLSRELSAGLRALAQRHGATLFMTLLAGWSTLLSRLSGQTDIVIGTPVANRQRAEIEPLIGFFVNTLALRVDLTNDPSVVDLLAQVRATMLDAHAHQDLPFEQVVEALQPERSLSHSPLFQALLTLNNTSADALTLPGLTLSTIEHAQQAAQFDLSLSLIETPDGLTGDLVYATDLFDRTTMQRMLGHWTTLLAAMVADETHPVGRLPLLSTDEREQVLTTFNAARMDEACEQPIHALFEAQAAQHPDAMALECADQRLRYDELNRRANQLAHHLIALGVKPDDRVALCMERGIGMIVGVLGILKAGAAYVPLDPDYPVERLAFMLDDSAPKALLTDAALEARLAALNPPRIVVLDGTDDDRDAIARQPEHNPDASEIGLAPRHLAYVIYTSGSTGRPKGVMVEHRQLLSSTLTRTQAYAQYERFLLLSSIAFDSSVAGIFGTLATAGTLLIPEEASAQNLNAIAELVERRRVTTLLCVPSLARLILDGLSERDDRTLKTIIVAGESCPPALRERVAAFVPELALYNEYGPTEATVWATLHRVRADEDGAVPIGRPIANTRIYVLDGHGAPVPVGVAGELHIGGDGVARGYLNRPELTAERFLDDPFASEPGARMYRTGDLGRWRPDGTLEYLGRNDFQVKLRGFRIELGEIEAKLAACDGVREAAVIVREDSDDDRRLVAYVVMQSGAAPSAADLRDQLSQALPDYMVPSAFVNLATLPLTPNGKLDRKALPAPDQSAVASRAYEAPVGETERALAAIWQDLLGLERVGRHDHFFELGGHSLLAVRLVTRLHAALGVDVALRDVFVQPTLSELARVVSAASSSSQGAIVPVDRNGALPLSWAQQRLWFLDQLDQAAGAAYHIPTALRLSGELNHDALQAALERVVARHESLRTTFVDVEGEPRQAIAPEDAGFALIRHDLRGLDADAQSSAVDALSADEARAPFDLARGPLIRGRLLQLAEHEHMLLVTQHHIVSDGWSIGVLVREVTALYAAFSRGAPDPLPPLPVQYADYAAWQRQWLQGDALQTQIGFWHAHLRGAPTLLELPTDRPRPAVQRYVGDRVDVHVPVELTAALRALSKRHGATLFMTLLAGWSTLLSRFSGQDDVVIGTPVANRQRAEIEPLIGFFVNTLALRVDLTADPSVAELLAQIKATTLGAYAHQDLPFEQVVETLQPERSLSHSPIFQVLLALNNTPGGDAAELPGLRLSVIDAAQRTAQFDLALSLTETPEGLAGGLTYAADLFDRDTVERMLACWTTLLSAMVADDAQSAPRLPLLSADARERVLTTFNATHADYPREPVHALFEAQAARQPHAIAVEFDGTQLTYGELNRRANRIAHRLIALGVKPDDRVAICAERSLEMVVGVLGALKAGGAYVPLDPAYPAERLAYFLEDSAPAVLLTQSALRDRLFALHAATPTLPCLLLDDDTETSSTQQPDHDPRPQGLASHHLAYVIYTSGSTGRPKGVAMPHRALRNLLAWQAGLDTETIEHERVLQFSALGFDVAFQELFYTLGSGGCLVLVSEAVRQDAFELAGFIRDRQVQRIFLPFVALQGLAAAAQHTGAALPSLRDVVTAGEQLFANPVIKAFFARHPACRLHNQYGPTESHVVTALTLSDAPEHWPTLPPIGRPIANTQIYVLDRHGEPVPVGVAGEIHIGGAGVARGYLNRPELTAERFLDDPFSIDPGARMYKTGDLGRWLPDGNIEYLGRNDFQVKIRGFRIELGEIEAKLAACPGVREAVVVAREDVAGDKRLVAYVVPQSDSGDLPIADLREHLSRDLPEYMIPSAFVSLTALPLTPNGKLDRKALPAPNQSAVATREYEAPIGETERAIAAIWQDLLGLDRIGRHDHFFELGGHSLLAVRLVTRLRASLGVDIALRDVFAQPTLSGLARITFNASASSQGVIVPADRNQPLPLSWAQQRLWFLDQLDHSASAAYHIPAALRLNGELNRAALQSSLDRIVARHESLRTTFVNIEGKPQQVIAPESIGFALTEYDLSNLDEAAQVAAIAEHSVDEASAAFDLATGPLIRGRLLRLAKHEHVLLVTQHHIVSDGWSIGVLIQEISALYTAFSQDQVDPLPALPIQYADYAAWQQRWLQGDVLQKQIDFWRSHLSGAPALLELPTDRPRPAAQSYVGDDVEVQLAPELTSALRALSQRHGVTLFMTLLAGWSALLSRLSGQDDVVIGSPIANRQRSEIEPLVGFFVNTLALRVDLSDDPSVADLLTQIKATTLGAYAHQDLPFEQVVEALQPERSLSHSPVFQVSLDLQNTPQNELQLPGLTLAMQETQSPTSQFDLTLALIEEGDALRGVLKYASDLFDRERIERLAGHLQILLQALAADATQRVSELPLLDEAELHRLLVTFNDTDVDYPRDQCIQARFEAQVAQRPDAIAVAFESERLSYGELNRRANQVAHRLVALGVKPDDRVAICTERNPAMVVGVLGILKAGGAYVPLDPAYPAERLAYMLDDSRPLALLTQASLAGVVRAANAGAAELATVLLDTDADATLATQPTRDPVVAGLTSAHLAYVIYTSGTTGQPKGVMVEHRSLVNYVEDAVRLFGIVPGDTVLQQNSLNFDISVEEMLPALCGGAALAPTSRVFGTADTDAASPLTVVHITAAHWHTLVSEWQRDPERAQRQLRGMRLFNVTGDALSTQKLQAWDALRPASLKLVNTYGPTETTVSCTAAYVQHDGLNETMASATIGRPLANTKIYILDAHLRPVPLGVAGELYIGGDGVTRGYLNRPELTAERFVRDPFAADPTARMYRSGDRARYRDDGNIEFLGRNDFQVKIRGFRVELGEIEARLAACAGVREAVVVVRGGVSGEKRLVAYVVSHEGATPSATALREELLRDLPDYMIPSAFVGLDALPLTPNGKLDRKALPEPDQAAVASREYAAPVGETERIVADVWQALLGVERVGRHDHFFELGGHSLLVIGLIEQLRRRGLGTDVRTVFMAPTLSALAAQLAGDAPARKRIAVPPNPITPATARITPDLLPLARLSQDEIDGIVAAVPGGVANIQDIYPLAPLQEGILFHHLLERETGGDTYLLCTVAEFDERGQLDAFLDALQRVIDRHDILRSAVHWQDLGKPVQVVQRRATLPIHALTLSGDAPALAQLLAYTDPRQMRLDLRQAPVLAAHIVRDPETGRWLLALLNHHVVCDHIAQDLILSEIQTVLEGRADALPPPMPYRDFIARTLAVSEAEHEAYFREQLGDVDEPTAPFGVLDVQADSDGEVEEGRVRLGDALAKRIRDSARREGVTPSVLFHVAWAQVLAQCSGRDDVVFGTVLSGRLQETESTEHVVGMFINTLPIRIPLANVGVGDAVRDTYRRLGALLTHEQSPLALAQRCSGIQLPLPLFTALLNYRHNLDDDGTVAPAWTGMRVISDEVRTNYPLTMSVDDFGQAFALVVQCGSGIDPDRMVQYLATAIEGVVDALERAPASPVRALATLPAFERTQVLHDFNATQTEYPHDATIAGLFEAQAARQPDADALEYDGVRLSYGELNRRANQVAHRLIASGVKPGARVAICTDRSLAMVVGLLGILKAGGAYVPLDPAYPIDRLTYMLADSAPMAVLTQAALRDTLPMLAACEVPVLVLDDASSSEAPTSNPVVADLTSRDVAYVIYTSGSTGQPKGVMVEHRSAVNFWQVMTRTTHRTCAPNSRVALNAAFSFDMSLKGLLQLLSGHCLVLIPQAIRASGPALLRFLEDQRIDAFDSTPSQLEGLLAAGLLEPLGHRPRNVLLGGEAIGPGMWERLKASPVVRFHNMYGPTEATVDATIEDISASTAGPAIGKPLANARIYLLDAQGEPVPLGVAGEIHIGGVGVARGYLNRPELTAERFLADPFDSAPNARMYKTGDLGRWRADGNLEYLGRNDFQVKIRGFRIELGEIEAKLRRCDGVREAVVIAREDVEGDKRLVAYVVPQEHAELSIANLRETLLQDLPEYMIPSACVLLDALPLNPNGKLDRRALPAPDQGAVASRAYEAPVGEVEQTMAAIWQELLGLERIGRNDHFFELGGHSLLVMQLVIRIREQFHVDVPLRVLFERPALSELAESIGELQQAVFLGEDLEGMQNELDALSEDELREMLDRESINE